MVVSTPTAAKGQKRKAQDESSKGKDKKTKRETIEYDPLYFHEDREQEMYNLDFSNRKVLNGRWINYDFFDSYHFEFSSKMDDLGWTTMILNRDDVY